MIFNDLFLRTMAQIHYLHVKPACHALSMKRWFWALVVKTRSLNTKYRVGPNFLLFAHMTNCGSQNHHSEASCLFVINQSLKVCWDQLLANKLWG